MSSYKGVKAVVTGGLGFIGSNLAIRLVNEGAHVTILDSLLPGCGGKWINIEPVRGLASVVICDIGDMGGDAALAIADADVIFNLAGEISHIHSMQFPERDLQVNTVSQLRFLIECSRRNRGVRVVYAGTRQVYGVPQYLPIDEAHPIQPVDFNGVHKYAATMYHRMLSRSGDLDAVVLRLTNVYGPRMAIDIGCQGFLSNFVRRALLNQPIEVFGDGLQFRDPVYIDDIVEAFLLAGKASRHSGSYNTGGAEEVTLLDIARAVAKQTNSPEPILRPFPEERKAIDIGSYSTDSRRIKTELGWQAGTNLDSGMGCTVVYFRSHLEHYIDPSCPSSPCPMPEHSGEPHRLRYGAYK